MKISIAMTSYNGATYLQQQLDSFTRQTRLPDELVVCDDCSSDDTVKVLKRFQKTAPFTVHIHCNQENLGFIKNFAQALSLCSGDLICLSDQDDIWLEDKLSTVEVFFNENPATCLTINDLFVSDELCQKRFFTKLSNVKALGLSKSAYIAGCATTIRAEFLKIALPIPSCIRSHDLWLNHLAIFLGARSILRQPLQLYRRHSDSVTTHSIAVNKRIRFPMFSRIKQFGLEDCRDGWRKEIAQRNEFIERLRSAPLIKNNLQLSQQHIDNSISQLNKKNTATEKRIELMSSGKIPRIPKIIQLWAQGVYGQFEGWKSAVKDMLR